MIPARIEPPARQPSGLAFVARFVRNPLEVVPREAYEEDLVPGGGGRVPRVWVTAPELVKTVLLDERDKFRKLTQIRLLGPLLGKGILTSEGAEWKWQRQASSPMFRPADLAGYVPVFVRAAEDELARWKAAQHSVVSVDEAMTRTTFDVICATLLPSSDARFGASIQRSLAGFQSSGGWELMFAALNLPRWLPRPWAMGSARAVTELREAVTALLRARRAAPSPPDDLMQRLVAARDPETGRAMGDEQLVDNLLTFYLAGHETTAKALTWTLYLLARSAHWSALLEEEVARVTGGGPVEAGHVERLVRVQQVVKESMRLYPPVPMMSRQSVAEVRLGDRSIKAGTSVLMPIYAIHRHRRRWEDADAFDPDRFAPEREEAMPRYQFMPFGAGPRVCIGRSFAMVEAAAILATLVRRVRFEPADATDPVPVARVTLMPKGGMRLRVLPR
jgi:cytochrome P450